MKRTLLALFLLTACSRAATTTTTSTGPVGATPPPSATSEPPRSGNQMTGAANPQLAVSQFLTAVHAQDIQAMATLFGTNKGPSRDNMNRDELEKRLIILQCYFNHDKFRIVSEFPGEGGHRIVTTELIRGNVARNPRFYVIKGPSNRFYVDNMEIAAVRDFCRSGTR